MITKLVDKLKELTSWFEELDDSQKETVVKIGLLVAAAGPLLVIIGQVATGVGALTVALSGAGGPILLAVTALGAFAGALYKAKKESDSYYTNARKLSEQEQQNKEKIEALADAYDQMVERRDEAVKGIEAEAAKEQELAKELQSITDENGNVKDGYEDRAKYILGELSEALGQEYTMTGNQIDQYKDLIGEIDTLIQKKQANALLSARESDYADALREQTDAYMAYHEAQENVNEAQERYNGYW